ncbi:MAG: barstar family protein [Anaerolineae bacterium]
MSDLDAIFSGQRPAGIYNLPESATPDELRQAVADNGWRLFEIDGSQITDKASFLKVAGKAMSFPGYVAANWDAFEEAIRDLAWAKAPGYVVLYTDADKFARQHPGNWRTLMGIFRSAIDTWKGDGVPMYVLLQGDGITAPDL